MIRYLYVLLLMTPIVTTAQQSTLGMLGGMTLSGYTSSTLFQNTNPLVGVSLGVYRGISLTESLDLEPGLYVSQRGVRYRIASTSREGRNRLSYLVLPIVVRKRLTNNFSVHIGPYVAGLLYGNYQNSDAAGSGELQTWGMFERDTNLPDARYDIGLQAGLRYVFPSQFVVNTSYELGSSQFLGTVLSDGPFPQTATVSVGYQW